MESAIIQEYLEAIFKFQWEGQRVGSTELGKELGVSPAAAFEMVDRLVERGLAKKTKEKGITLTDTGRKSALTVIRRHRISERFLVDVLGMDWKDVHDEACKLEHVISPEVESRIEALLKNTSTCPHGHPIPDKLGHPAHERLLRLSALKPHQTAVIARIAEERRELLEYLATLGMMPDCEVQVERVAPFDGPLLVQIKGAIYALGREIAEKVWVKEK